MNPRNRTNCRLVATAILIFLSRTSSALDISTYKNSEHGFSFSYPSDWTQRPTRTREGVVKISSDGGRGAESCSMVITTSPALSGLSTEQAVRNVKISDIVGEIKAGGIKSVSVVESGHTTIVARDAFYAILQYSIPMAGSEFPMKVLTVITTKSDKVFNFSCGTADVASFPTLYPLFRFITGTLYVFP